jgi:hypothetical protein
MIVRVLMDKNMRKARKKDEEDGEHKPAKIPTPPATVTKKWKHVSKKGVSIDTMCCNFALHSLTFYC